MNASRVGRPPLLAYALVAISLGLGGCVQLQLFGGLPQPLEETVVMGAGGAKILLLKVDGVISTEPPRGVGLLAKDEDSMVSRVSEALDNAREDPEVKALLLRIDSPGGTASASDVVYSEVLRFKRDRRVPVVAYMMGTATSGAYYVAMAADHVIAHPTTVTGSIGVIFLSVNFAGLMEKLGIENQTLVAGRYKDEGSALRRMRPVERTQLQSILDDLHAYFQQVVVHGRPQLDAAQVRELADGRIFGAKQALDAGLVDGLGDLVQAVEIARRRANLSEARVVTYHRPSEYENNIFTGGAAALPERVKLELPSTLEWLARPGFYYLWAPGIR